MSKAEKMGRAEKRRAESKERETTKSEMEKSSKLSSTMHPAQGFSVTKKPKTKVSALIKKHGNSRSK